MAYEDTDLDLIHKLYYERSTKGVNFQPTFLEYLSNLNEIATRHKVVPFDLSNNARTEMLNTVDCYASGGTWKNADILKNVVFHRVEKATSFFSRHFGCYLNKKMGYGFDSLIPIPSPPAGTRVDLPRDIAELAFTKLIDLYKEQNDWLDLSKLINQYNSHRAISWWTDSYDYSEFSLPKYFTGKGVTIENKWIVDFAHRVGMVNDWLSDNLIFFSFNSNDAIINEVKVPSIIDAYEQPIFLPRKENEHPKCGFAIHINVELTPNYREYIVTKIPIDKVKFIPIKISTSELKKIGPYATINDELVSKLIEILK